MGAKPMWSADTKSIYFVDIFGQQICRYDPETNLVHKASLNPHDEFTGYISPIYGKPNNFLIGSGNTAVNVYWDGNTETAKKGDTILEIEPNTNLLTLFVSPDNRTMFVGGFKQTFCKDPDNVSLHVWTNDVQTIVANNFKSVTGIALDENKNLMYVMDSCGGEAHAFDFNPETNELCK